MEIEELKERVDEALYAMVYGNLANAPVPTEEIERWLKYIIGEENVNPCTLCMGRQLENCERVCKSGKVDRNIDKWWLGC